MQNQNSMYVPIARTRITKDDIQSVVGPIRSCWLLKCPKVREFEAK